MTCFFFHNLHISWAQKNKQTTKPIHYNRFIIGELVSREQIGAATFLLKRRRKYYYYNEYPFVLDRRRNQNEYYHCAQNVASDCKARLVIKNVPDTNAQITSIKQHNHTDKGGMYEIFWRSSKFTPFGIFVSFERKWLNIQLISQRFSSPFLQVKKRIDKLSSIKAIYLFDIMRLLIKHFGVVIM